MSPKKVEQLCPTHNEPLIKVKGTLYCKSCLYSSHLTYEAQRDATKKWRQSDKGVKSEKDYEQSEKGKTARERYLKSDKYRAARRAYNQRLKESLAIARAARTGSTGKITEEELRVATGLEGLLAEVKEYMDENFRPPTVKNVIDTAKLDYNQVITEARARELITAAEVRRRK